jgi:hypothetical protein
MVAPAVAAIDRPLDLFIPGGGITQSAGSHSSPNGAAVMIRAAYSRETMNRR